MTDSMHVSSASETSVAGNGSADDNNDQVLLNELVPLWRDHHNRGLELRHKTGLGLIKRFGTPGERQEYGKATLRLYSEKLGVSESELSRMRRFAEHFKSFEDFKTQRPTVTTWTKVKVLLAELRHPAVPVAEASDNQKKSVAERPVDQMIGAARAIQKHANNVGQLPLDSSDWKALNKAVRGMLKAVEANLGGHFTFTPTTMSGHSATALAKNTVATRSRSVGVENPPSEVLATVA